MIDPLTLETPKRRSLPFLAMIATLFVGLTLTSSVLADDKAPQVSLKTSLGEIVLELDAVKAPLTVENFLGYVKSGFYNGTIFHRVIEDFMIQGGGFDTKLEEKKTGPSIPNESKNGLKNATYTIAMARLSEPNSATAQFFINVKENPDLDYPKRSGSGYAVFGRVVKGKEVVDKIKATPVSNKGGAFQNLPEKLVVIESATVLK
jgi:peptidyl-prolyl cis-trans isomerase A (cyclophilin A)